MNMKNQQSFEHGQVVTATCSYGYVLTEGKQYIVMSYEPPMYTPVFTWPAYVTVLGDHGEPVVAHTYRFKGEAND